MRKETHELAFAGILGALAVVLLCLGGVVPLATYAAPILASATLLAAREECRPSCAWSCYAASAALGLLLSPDKEAALLYAFLGYYPLLKPRLDMLRPRVLRVGAKLLLAVAAVGAMYALALFVLRLDAIAREFAQTAPALLWATAALGVATFFVYDLLLTRLASLYRSKRKPRR
ncbi:MAG: hypothetical protein E7422_08220 [Ruminococcaceae bacterium]|nr:hypothetical protein [Oscillospiraceae bacterium]